MLRKQLPSVSQRAKKRKMQQPPTMEIEVMENEALTQWTIFFEKTWNVDMVLERAKLFSYSENGIDIEITQRQLDKCLEHLSKANLIYKKYKRLPPMKTQQEIMLSSAGYLSRYEHNFNQLISRNILELILAILEANNASGNDGIKCSFVSFVRSLFEHDAGVRWLMETNCWTYAYNFVLQCQKGERGENITNALSNILQKTSKIAPKICLQIIKQMTQTLINAALKHLSKTKQQPIIPISVSECTSLNPYVTCVVEILERLLASPTVDILNYFIKLQVREACETLSLLSVDTEFCLKLDRVMIILSFYEMTDLFDGIKVVNHDPIALSGFLKIVEREMKKEHINTILKLYYYAQKYWKNVSRKMPKYFVKEKPIDIEDELMSFQVEPLVVIAEKLFGIPMTAEEELRNCFLADLLNLYSVNCLQLGYEIRKHLSKLPLQIEITTLECLIKSKPLYSRKNLAIVFQVLIYSLRDFTKYVKQKPMQGQFDQDQQFADTLLQAILVYLENFDLSWRESIGSIELTYLVYEFLHYSTDWPPLVIRKALEILNTTISKHMSPNMALLVDTTQHSSLNELGSLLFTKCFSNCPEVRNTALTVVCTICHKANSGFTSFKTILEEALLPDLILTMALRDLDRSVRATALKCLQEIVDMKDTGQTLLNNGFVDKILGTFPNEEDPQVVKEIVILIRKLYQNNELLEEDMFKIYNFLSQLAIKINPEVQEYAVNFWEQVLRSQLEKQGMIDDEFPPVIFSKEHRKIVKLDDKEIRKRLFKALNSMSSAGCFDVFQNILKNEGSPRSVSRLVTKIVTKLLKLLHQYEVTPEFILFNQTYPNLWSIQSMMPSPSNHLEGDERMQEMIEDSVMEMINESEYFTNNRICSPCTDANSETGESYNLSSSQQSRISTLDFIDFLYRKLPCLGPENMDLCNNNTRNRSSVNNT